MTAGTSQEQSAGKSVWRSGRGIEWLFAVALIGGLVKAYVDLRHLGYLPLPFWPDPNDVYADGYSTAWWAFNGGMYDTWRTVYPPLSFVLTKAFGETRCYDADVGFVRDCDWSLWLWTLAFYLLNAGLAYRSFRANDRGSAVPRAVMLMLGLPMLYSFEHLNLLVYAYTGLIVMFGIGVRSARVRWLAIAIAINLKVYLIVVLAGQLLKRRWRAVEWSLIATAVVYAVSFAIVGHGTPMEVYRNIAIFASDADRSSNWYFVFYASSYASMVEFFNSQFRLMPIVGSWELEFWGNALTVLLRVVQLASLAAFVAIWATPAPISRTRIAALCYLLVLISNETGGYTAAGAIFLVFFEPWRGAGRITALVSSFMLCLAFDYRLVPIGSHVTDAYFGGRPVWQDMWLSAGPFARPGLLILMQIGLIGATWGDLMRHRRERRSEASLSSQPILA
ncbi:glycosyltransferase family 87 protein [uncultured Sphingomonas sp.]|uniref:glycosyltransferase family 87 protein n=1 Tax=uncultured Sphingomonas sp. TaxID=158754 RepID=UPI0035CC17FC